MAKRGSEDEDEKKKEPLVYKDLIESFKQKYSPCSSQELADEELTIGELRNILNSYVAYTEDIDPFPTYLQMLSMSGFVLAHNYEGVPVLLVNRIKIPFAEEYAE